MPCRRRCRRPRRRRRPPPGACRRARRGGWNTPIGLGLLALALIFQPFALGLFSVGCGLVVLAGLVNNLLPLARPGVPVRTVVKVALIVAVIFVIVTALSIGSAWLYGVYVEGAAGGAGIGADPSDAARKPSPRSGLFDSHIAAIERSILDGRVTPMTCVGWRCVASVLRGLRRVRWRQTSRGPLAYVLEPGLP